ncbi:MAG: single-stranded DNA-binding protein [Bdellovibrionales bacterium]
MQGINKIFLMGYLGSTPKLNSSSGGKQYTGLSLATHRSTQRRFDGRDSSLSGEGDNSSAEANDKKKATDWHYVHVWGKQAELCTKYLTKGQPVMVEGYLTQYTQKNEAGVPKTRTSINALKVEFLPRLSSASSASDENGRANLDDRGGAILED